MTACLQPATSLGVQRNSVPTLQRFCGQDRVGGLLTGVRIAAKQVDFFHCVSHTLDVLKQEQRAITGLIQEPLPPGPRAAAHSQPRAARMQQSRDTEPVDPAPAINPEVQAVINDGRLDEGTVLKRLRQLRHRRAKLERQELEKVPQFLPALVAEGRLTEEEGKQFTALCEIDEMAKRREIDAEEADRHRETILTADKRKGLGRKVEKAVTLSVLYLQVFEGLKRISPEYDDVLRFLVEHKKLVVADKAAPDRSPLITALLADDVLLEQVFDIMECRDQEIRFIALRLPPYKSIVQYKVDTISNPTIDETFIDDLRYLDAEDISERLHAPEQEVRVRTAADLRCFINLIDQVAKPTPFRKKIRLIQISRVLEAMRPELEELYRSSPDADAGWVRVRWQLRQRLERFYADVTAGELHEINKRGEAVLIEIDQSIRGERVEVRLRKKAEETAEREKAELDRATGDENQELTEEEMRKGVQIGRVEMRMGSGVYKKVRTKVMPDPADPSRCVVAVRDVESGETVPQMRRGAKRFVEKNREGIWKGVDG